MSTELLSNTLEQLHVRVVDGDIHDDFPFGSLIRMNHLHTFTLAQDYFSSRPVSSTTIEQLVDMDVMPVLRRLNLAIFVRVNEMNRIGRFLRFNDQRRVMVHFALMTSYHRSHRKLTDLLPRGSIHHPREVVGVTYVVNRERMDVSKDPFVRDVFFFRLENISSWAIIGLFLNLALWTWNISASVVHSSMDFSGLFSNISVGRVFSWSRSVYTVFIGRNSQSISNELFGNIRRHFTTSDLTFARCRLYESDWDTAFTQLWTTNRNSLSSSSSFDRTFIEWIFSTSINTADSSIAIPASLFRLCSLWLGNVTTIDNITTVEIFTRADLWSEKRTRRTDIGIHCRFIATTDWFSIRFSGEKWFDQSTLSLVWSTRTVHQETSSSNLSLLGKVETEDFHWPRRCWNVRLVLILIRSPSNQQKLFEKSLGIEENLIVQPPSENKGESSWSELFRWSRSFSSVFSLDMLSSFVDSRSNLFLNPRKQRSMSHLFNDEKNSSVWYCDGSIHHPLLLSIIEGHRIVHYRFFSLLHSLVRSGSLSLFALC